MSRGSEGLRIIAAAATLIDVLEAADEVEMRWQTRTAGMVESLLL